MHRHHKNIGPIREAYFNPVAKLRSVIVASDVSIASLSTRTGAISMIREHVDVVKGECGRRRCAISMLCA